MKQEDREAFVFASYAIHLWRHRVWIIVGGIVCALLTALFVQFIARERFRAFSQIMIKEQRKITGAERDTLTPVSYEYLLLNQELIRQVRNEYAKEIGMPAHSMILEMFMEAFQVDSDLVQDTTVRKEYSPVMELAVDADSPPHAQMLMQIWLKQFMKRYGDLLARESDYASRFYSGKAGEVQKALKEKEDRFLVLRRELPFKIRELTSKELLVSPAMVELDYQDTRRSYYKYRDENRIEVNMPEPIQQIDMEGLEKKLVDTEIALAEAKATNDTELTVSLEAKRKAISGIIEKTRKEIAALQKESADMEKEFSELAREVTSLRDQYQYVMDLKNQAEVEAEGYHYGDKLDSDERSDIIILAKPSLPEKRVYPKKVFSCLIALLAGLVLTALAILFDKFIRESRTLVEGSKKS